MQDFAGPYMINTGSLMFGNPAKYIQLDPGHVGDSAPSMAAAAQDSGNDEWDAALHVSAVLSAEQLLLCFSESSVAPPQATE